MSKRALLIGIDDYTHISKLHSCVGDAIKMSQLLQRNEDGSTNFECIQNSSVCTSADLHNAARTLFNGEGDTALFYFSGHGTRDENNCYLVPADAQSCAECFSLTTLLQLVNHSKFRNRIVILDSCFSGEMGNATITQPDCGTAAINSGVTILTSCRPSETAIATRKGSLFTNLLLEALRGGAADVLGRITSGSIYAYIDKALGAWDQRPLYKTNVCRFNIIRKVSPSVPESILRNLTTYFQHESDDFYLNPSFEWTNDPTINHELKEPYADPGNVETFKTLQKLSYNGLVVPVDSPYMYNAAMESKSCRLTELGKQYWRLVNKERI